jgi:hypothetical protein
MGVLRSLMVEWHKSCVATLTLRSPGWSFMTVLLLQICCLTRQQDEAIGSFATMHG